MGLDVGHMYLITITHTAAIQDGSPTSMECQECAETRKHMETLPL